MLGDSLVAHKKGFRELRGKPNGIDHGVGVQPSGKGMNIQSRRKRFPQNRTSGLSGYEQRLKAADGGGRVTGPNAIGLFHAETLTVLR